MHTIPYAHFLGQDSSPEFPPRFGILSFVCTCLTGYQISYPMTTPQLLKISCDILLIKAQSPVIILVLGKLCSTPCSCLQSIPQWKMWKTSETPTEKPFLATHSCPLSVIMTLLSWYTLRWKSWKSARKVGRPLGDQSRFFPWHKSLAEMSRCLASTWCLSEGKGASRASHHQNKHLII